MTNDVCSRISYFHIKSYNGCVWWWQSCGSGLILTGFGHLKKSDPDPNSSTNMIRKNHL